MSSDFAEFKLYWFSRDLVASRYGSFSRLETDALRTLSNRLDNQLASNENLETLIGTIEGTILGAVSPTYGGDISKRYRQTEDLVERILRRIENKEHIRELQIAIDAVVRTSEILDTAPGFGVEEIKDIVDESLLSDSRKLDPTQAYNALYNVDIEGEAYQLGAQREPLVEYVGDLIRELEGNRMEVDEVARIVSGIVQEYERRAGQSRASTAGNVLETALHYIFEQFRIPATGSPEHFGDLEIDNIVRGPSASVGFSCKRTLRERFRQSLKREVEIDVDEVWFVSLMTADVSREKLQDIRNDESRIYIRRDSFVWDRYSGDADLSYTLRPADEFLYDISEFTGVRARI